MAKAEIKIIKTSARQYRDLTESDELIAPAEYAVIASDSRLALIIKAQDGWRICVPTKDSKIGMAISPIDMNAFREVRDWALKYFSRKKRGGVDVAKPNLQGRCFNYLRVTHYMGRFGTVERFWRTICEQWINGQPCNRPRLVSTSNLTSGRVYACERCSKRMGIESMRQTYRIRREQRYEIPESVRAIL
jgi:hypothetical protein